MNNKSHENRRPQRPASAPQQNHRPTQSAPQRPPQQRPIQQRPIQQRPPQQRPIQQRPLNQPISQIPEEKTTSDRRLYTVAAITATIVVLIIIALLIFAVNRATGCADKDRDDSPSAPVSALLGETEDKGQSYIDSMIFVGDSNTAHMRSFGVLSDGKQTKQVWSPKSQTITLNSQVTSVKIVYPETGAEMTIAEAVALKKPEYLVISLGTNGLTYLDEDQFKYCYKKLLDAIQSASPQTKIMVQSIYPVTSWYENIPNERINDANGWLLTLANDEGVKYLDTASVLKDSSGALKEAYNADHKDGYHINAEAYREILQYIRTHGYEQ